MGYTILRDSEGVMVTTITVERGQPILRPDKPRLRAELLRAPVRIAGRRVGPGAGDRWLKALEETYRGSHLRAEFRDT